jgi:hypothetical protein
MPKFKPKNGMINFGGAIATDARGKVVFRLRDEAEREVGYEVRALTIKPTTRCMAKKACSSPRAIAR